MSFLVRNNKSQVYCAGSQKYNLISGYEIKFQRLSLYYYSFVAGLLKMILCLHNAPLSTTSFLGIFFGSSISSFFFCFFKPKLFNLREMSLILHGFSILGCIIYIASETTAFVAASQLSMGLGLGILSFGKILVSENILRSNVMVLMM